MTQPMKAVLNIVRLLVAIQIGMGILIWMGKGSNEIMLHMAFGLLFVVLGVAFAVMAKAKGAPASLTWVAILWGIVTVGVGMEQARVLVGPNHWIIRVVHFILGLGMAGQVERLAKSVKGKVA